MEMCLPCVTIYSLADAPYSSHVPHESSVQCKSNEDKQMKPLKFAITAIVLSGATLAMAQTSTPAADSQAAQQSSQAPRQDPNCVGPASYCTVFFGGS